MTHTETGLFFQVFSLTDIIIGLFSRRLKASLSHKNTLNTVCVCMYVSVLPSVVLTGGCSFIFSTESRVKHTITSGRQAQTWTHTHCLSLSHTHTKTHILKNASLCGFIVVVCVCVCEKVNAFIWFFIYPELW